MGAWSSALSSRGHRKAYRWPFLFCWAVGYPVVVAPARQDEHGHPGARWLGFAILGLALASAEAGFARPQDSIPLPTHAQMRLERFLGDAAARTDEYFTLFQDLTAEETKTIEIFRGATEVARTRRVVSDLVVYQAHLDNASIAEYRDVRVVDGTPVPGREDRVGKLSAQRAGVASIRDELQRITKESTRYDLDRTISGLTITEGLPLQAWARALFAFTVVGTERIEGRSVIVVDYRQRTSNPRFGFKFSLPADVGPAQPLYRGRLWIDAATAHLWRERREIAVDVDSHVAPAPLVIQSTDFTYKESRFGVPLPGRIVFTSSLKFDKGADRALQAVPVFRVTFEYGPFKRFTTTSDEEMVAATPTDRTEGATVASAAPPSKVDEGLGPEFGPNAPETGYTYEQLVGKLAEPATPADPAPAASGATLRPAPKPPAPKTTTTVVVPSGPKPPETAPQPTAEAPRSSPPVVEPLRPTPPPVRRPPHAVRRIFEMRTAVPLPAALASVPALHPSTALSPPPLSPAPVDSPPAPRKAWRPPPS
jgi:hypothetical protein